MGKRFKYLISSALCALTFALFLYLPYESRYYGILSGVALIVFLFWFGLGIIFEKNNQIRIMSVLLPVGFFVGLGLFSVLLPLGWLGITLISLFFGIIIYLIFLVENVFMVAIGSRIVPLYRAAYTVSLIILLLTSFFLFDSLLSFKLAYWGNILGVFLISLWVFMYQFWAVAIELPDDGAKKSLWIYSLIPAWIMAQLGLVFSFWPVGIFRGSIYLVLFVYVLSGLLEADIRGRLFRKTWLLSVWVGVAVLLGIIVVTAWR